MIGNIPVWGGAPAPVKMHQNQPRAPAAEPNSCEEALGQAEVLQPWVRFARHWFALQHHDQNSRAAARRPAKMDENARRARAGWPATFPCGSEKYSKISSRVR